mmetsp:Transcript_24589/g.57739  ORF Transcript_24589/g.57739 Transcript_24589/m.57739 type:complete len:89 (+) Transcript_24589:254-520(+)
MIFRLRKCRLKLCRRQSILRRDNNIRIGSIEMGVIVELLSFKSKIDVQNGLESFLVLSPSVSGVLSWIGCVVGWLDRQSTPTSWDSDL